jgi:hypothetical protein
MIGGRAEKAGKGAWYVRFFEVVCALGADSMTTASSSAMATRSDMRALDGLGGETTPRIKPSRSAPVERRLGGGMGAYVHALGLTAVFSSSIGSSSSTIATIAWVRLADLFSAPGERFSKFARSAARDSLASLSASRSTLFVTLGAEARREMGGRCVED